MVFCLLRRPSVSLILFVFFLNMTSNFEFYNTKVSFIKIQQKIDMVVFAIKTKAVQDARYIY